MIAPTPPMGWNSWNTFGANIHEDLVKETADVFNRYGQMLEDGVLASVEGKYLRKEIREAIEALVLMDMQVEAQLGGGGK